MLDGGRHRRVGLLAPFRREMTPPPTWLLNIGSKESQDGIAGPSHRWDCGGPEENYLRSHSSQWQT